MSSDSTWEAVIGLEIHAQLLTQSKLFSSDSCEFGGGDNEHTSPVSLGMPGALPVMNRKALELSIITGLGLNCEIREKSVFARKQYFYPDLPKGYQISQYDEPLCVNGFVEFLHEGEVRRVTIERAHLEEDAGKSLHQGEQTLINLNRAGVPLLEIVSGPDLRSASEAADYARAVRSILLYLEVCDGNLEEGSMRCDCNVSIRKKGAPRFGTKVEIKNVNSFRFIEKAIEYEIQRQIDNLESGESIAQETRLYDPTKNRTVSMRSKEEAHDYRYFPDPDLLPVHVNAEWIAELREALPELPLERAKRFEEGYGLPRYDSLVLTAEKGLAEYFEKVAKSSGHAKASSNWIMAEVMRELKNSELEPDQIPIPAESLAKMIQMIDAKALSGKMAKQVFSEMWSTHEPPDKVVARLGITQITDTGAVEQIVNDVLSRHTEAVQDYRSGKTKLFGFFVGQVMKASKGQANPELVNQVLKSKLDSSS